MKHPPTRSGLVLLAVILAALDEVLVTLPPAIRMHVAAWLPFALAVLDLMAAVLAWFDKDGGAPSP